MESLQLTGEGTEKKEEVVRRRVCVMSDTRGMGECEEVRVVEEADERESLDQRTGEEIPRKGKIYIYTQFCIFLLCFFSLLRPSPKQALPVSASGRGQSLP